MLVADLLQLLVAPSQTLQLHGVMVWAAAAQQPASQPARQLKSGHGAAAQRCLVGRPPADRLREALAAAAAAGWLAGWLAGTTSVLQCTTQVHVASIKQ